MRIRFPAYRNRGKKPSEIELGLHDPRFLPFGDVGIGRPQLAGIPPQLASMKSGDFRRVRTHRARLQAATGPNDPGMSRGASEHL